MGAIFNLLCLFKYTYLLKVGLQIAESGHGFFLPRSSCGAKQMLLFNSES